MKYDRRMIAAFLFCMSAALSLGLLGCDKGKGKEDDDDPNEKQVAIDKVPAAALASMQKEIEGAKLKRVLIGMKKGKPYYEGKYNTPDGNRMMIQVDESGKVLKKEKDDDPEPK